VKDIFGKVAELQTAEEEAEFEQPSSFESSGGQIADVLEGPPETLEVLSTAESNLNPAFLSPETRAKTLKRIILRVMRLYYRGQVKFNAAIFQVLAAWDARLRRLLDEVSVLTARWNEQTIHKLTTLNQRINELRLRHSSEITALGERIGESEEDFVRMDETILQQNKRLDKVEESFLDRLDKLDESGKAHQNAMEELTAHLESSLSETRQENEARLLPLQEEIAALIKHSEFLTAKVAQMGSDLNRMFNDDLNKNVLSPAMYFEFENVNRGNREQIIERQEVYLPILKRFAEKFQNGAKFIDVGCGRGELLQIAYRGGIDMIGYDSNPVMVAFCRSLGLKANESDLMKVLASCSENSLAGITALQVIEHLSYSQISSFFQLAHTKIMPGGCVIVETINPLSIFAMRYFYMDPTHRQPVPATTCEFLLKEQGYVDLEKLELNRVEEDHPAVKNLQNQDPDHPLIDVLFGYQDYALIAMKP